MKTTLSVLVLCWSCILMPMKMYHDDENPCTPGEYYDKEACEEWKVNFPKEYYHYKDRMKMDSLRGAARRTVRL
jgi:hypothetical protein